MRDIQNVTISRAIAHLVLPRQARLVLSDSELGRQAAVLDYLAGHVRRALDDPQAGAADFVTVGPDQASGLCDRLLGARPHFVDLSRRLASRLYDVTEGDDRISDAALIILLCEGRLPDGPMMQFVGILKLDPGDAFRPVERKSRGKVAIELEMEEDILPRNERVQKAAFVRPKEPSVEYRILLVDRQTEKPAARFFRADFLGADFILDAKARTERLHRSLQRARNIVAPELPAKELAALDQVLAGAQVATRVNLDDLVPSLPVPEPVQAQIDEIVSAALPDREFDLDPAVAERLVKRRTFEADNSLRVSVPAEFFEEMVRIEDVPNTDPPKRRVIIETQTWRER